MEAWQSCQRQLTDVAQASLDLWKAVMSNNTPGIAAYANFTVTTFLFFDAKLIISNNCESYSISQYLSK